MKKMSTQDSEAPIISGSNGLKENNDDNKVNDKSITSGLLKLHRNLKLSVQKPC